MRALSTLEAPATEMSSDGQHKRPYTVDVKDLMGSGLTGKLTIWPGPHTAPDYFAPLVGDEFRAFNVDIGMYKMNIKVNTMSSTVFAPDELKNMLGKLFQKNIYFII